MTDPILLAAQARPVLEKLHGRNDVVVRLVTDKSGYAEDATTDLDKAAPGHFRVDKRVLTLNLDTLVKSGRIPASLGAVEDWRKYPVLAGVAAHESAHARFSRWGEAIPESIPNPDYDPSDPDNPENGPERFPVSETGGALIQLAHLLEEPRIERLGLKAFSKTWRRAMQLSAGHLILEQADEDNADGVRALDSAVRMTALIGGRVTAGTLGTTYESRRTVKKVLDSARKVIEEALSEYVAAGGDPYHEILQLVNKAVLCNEHDDPATLLEIARQILKIVHPEQAANPDGHHEPDEDEDEEGGGEGSGEGGPGKGEGESESDSAVLTAMKEAMREALDEMGDSFREMVHSEESMPDSAAAGGGYGSTIYQNPRAPQIDRYEDPTADDRALYRRALEWMERQVEPTVTQTEVGQWLPSGGATLNVRNYIRDNLAGHRGNQRTDWDRVSETVKPAPPVKVAVMLDGSGSMNHMARPSASIAWAAANAAADLPESRTVSVVYGAAAQVTQEPGHVPARRVAVSRTDGPTEDFYGAAKMVEEALWLDEPMEEGERSNVLIIIVSDLMYGGQAIHPDGTFERQGDAFTRITKDWAERGFRTVVVGADERMVKAYEGRYGMSADYVELVKPEDLFR